MKHPNRIIAFLLCAIMILALIPAAAADAITLPGMEKLGEDTVMVGARGTFTENQEEVLHALNLIRYQACWNGEPDPRNRTHALALADRSGGENPSDEVLAQENGDYIPALWDSYLQRIAEIRAVEASFCFDHTRPNGASCFSITHEGARSSCECLAQTADALYSLRMYCSERSTWVSGGDGETGHYTAMISPALLCYGIAGFSDATDRGYYASALEAETYWQGVMGPAARSGEYVQTVEIPADYITGATISGAAEMQPGAKQSLSLLLDSYGSRTLLPHEPIVWESMTPALASVYADGTMCALEAGDAKIRATFAGQTAELAVTIAGEPVSSDVPVHTGQCGDNVFWKLYENGTLTLSGTGGTWNFSDHEPTFYEYMEDIKRVELEDGVTEVGLYLIWGLKQMTSLHLSKSVRWLVYGNWGTPSLRTITVDPESPYLVAIDDVLFSKDMRYLQKYAAQKPDEYYSVPEGVESFNESACSLAVNLKTLVIPASVKTFAEVVWGGCENLTDVYFRGLPPEENAGSMVFGDVDAVIHYPDWLEDAWTGPNHEWTTWQDYRLVPYSSPVETAAFDGRDVQYKGTTPYVIANGKAQTPRVVVQDEAGRALDPSEYTVTYRDNKEPGTAYVDVQMLSGGPVKTLFFKIYLPATKQTTVENEQDGIRIAWDAVPGAKGYVVYRRAWNLKSSGWTDFARWDNTTETTYLDGHDENHRTYAGTRYQYGVKAYFGDPMDNYNLGVVGPLKTTVRITTRTLNSVTAGKKQLTVKWSGSKNFTGYEVQLATDKAFTKNVKTVKIADAKTYETVVKGLKAKTTYYVRVRSYTEFEGFTYYGGWSNVLSRKTK